MWIYNEVLEIFAEASKICCVTANKALNNITNWAIHVVKEGNILKLSGKNMYRSSLLDGCIDCHGGARGVMVIVIGNGHGDTSSNPGRDWLHFT